MNGWQNGQKKLQMQNKSAIIRLCLKHDALLVGVRRLPRSHLDADREGNRVYQNEIGFDRFKESR